MLGFRKADLVQCLRSKSPKDGGAAANSSSSPQPDAKTGTTTNEPYPLSIIRMNLTDLHESGWKNVVLPRLYQFARFIYRLRRDEDLRHMFLLTSDDEERLEFIRQHCPYF